MHYKISVATSLPKHSNKKFVTHVKLQKLKQYIVLFIFGCSSYLAAKLVSQTNQFANTAPVKHQLELAQVYCSSLLFDFLQLLGQYTLGNICMCMSGGFSI